MSFKLFLRKNLPENWILILHKMRAVAAAYYYRFPAKKLKVLGVTGTNGKTTTCHMITNILEAAGHKVGMATTIDFKIGNKFWANESRMTMINPFALQKLLRRMVNEGVQWAVIETTSHAITQFRNWGIKYEGAVLTNITHEHLDYHKSFQEYVGAKKRLFAQAKMACLNLDDENAKELSDLPVRYFNYAIEDKKAEVSARKILPEAGGTLFTLVSPKGQLVVNLSLPGKFNVYNGLAAATICLSQNLDIAVIKKGLEATHIVPGRMEKIDEGQDFTVIVDYAHTPDALKKLYEAVGPLAKGKIIAVFGACGDRDRIKRPLMGAIAGKEADIVIITNEDPYTELPRQIMEEVASGVPRGADKENPKKEGENFWVIEDRGEAIKKALFLARKDDVVLITGKGNETSIVVGNKKIPWSDREKVKELLRNKLGG